MTERTERGILTTDAYQLTMAQLYFAMGMHERDVRFEHFFRSNPDYGEHQAGYCIAAGLGPFVEWTRRTRTEQPDVEALRGHRGRTGEPLFTDAFCEWMSTVDFGALRIQAVPEGRVVHPNTPVTAVEGPMAVAQLIETPLLNQLNFPTLIATKTSRTVEAAEGQPVFEFGLRRAAGAGADAASRASIVGGAVATSNAGAAYRLGMTPVGTHAHSMVQVFMALGYGELGAFRAYADVFPDDCLLLVDTVDTLESGLPNAITVFEELRRSGHEPVGIRLDSGDLAYLAVRAGRQLDAAGFDGTTIVLSSQLDEITIWQILQQIRVEAPRQGLDADQLVRRLSFGVGSRLATSHGASSLDGVYKLVAVDEGGSWTPAMKVSDSPSKVLNPGVKRLWRLYDDAGSATADVLSTAEEDFAATVGSSSGDLVLHHHGRPDVSRNVEPVHCGEVEELAVPVLDRGELVYPGGPDALDDLGAARARRDADVARLDPGVRRLVNPHVYHVSLTDGLHAEKQALLQRFGRS